MRFDTDVRQHAAQDDLADTTLAELQHQVISLRTPNFVGTHHDRLAVFDIGLEALEPVRARSAESVESQWPASSEDLVGKLDRFQRIVEFPSAVGRIEVMGRDEHGE